MKTKWSLEKSLLPVEEMHWYNVNAGSPHSRSKDTNAKMSTSKSQTTRYDVVYRARVLVHHKQKARVHNIPSNKCIPLQRTRWCLQESLLTLEYTRWHNVQAGSPQSRSRDANAKMSTSKRQTSRYAVVNEIESSNSEYQDVWVYAMKSIRLMYVHKLSIDFHSKYMRQQDAELTSTSTHHNAQNDQEKLLALRVACHHTAQEQTQI